ncbi:hypothetical protein P280DRAFT_84211 [Massarina eburnea CBS 473.64]|uniref:Uncharacterized protein n=1 Tax=Massarina eburnea CBS 473.64 TaxID=1395130 RepID=A0A6A6RST7_9PLEO|nr:hypothetical protein P280DRAFT_84211 [Massarina eburnea CBS 473.64]
MWRDTLRVKPYIAGYDHVPKPMVRGVHLLSSLKERRHSGTMAVDPRQHGRVVVSHECRMSGHVHNTLSMDRRRPVLVLRPTSRKTWGASSSVVFKRTGSRCVRELITTWRLSTTLEMSGKPGILRSGPHVHELDNPTAFYLGIPVLLANLRTASRSSPRTQVL